MSRAEDLSTPTSTDACWVLDVALAVTVTLPDGGAVPRDDWFGWLWEACGAAGLLGIGEGTVDVGEAAALGIAAPRVVDAAAAPMDRDWVGSLAQQETTCWFADEAAARRAAELLLGVDGCTVRDIRPLAVASARDWRDSFAPIEVPGFGVVRPAWEAGVAGTEAGRTTMFIEPGCGFGTGRHETTRLCLAALAAWLQEGGRVSSVLDFGSGSGILAIAAALRGAERVVAVEIDGRTHDAIRENGRRNGVAERIDVLAEMPDTNGPYDVVFANIVPAVLLEHAERLCGRVGRVAPGNCLVLSGLLADEVGPVTERYGQLLRAAPGHTSLGEWHCLRFAAVG
ncbi:MAG: 50S ribosomal protein L11 methyltransferase [Planctomycetia bacterium]|jgi:ribosomal protein L11 methyltransferase